MAIDTVAEQRAFSMPTFSFSFLTVSEGPFFLRPISDIVKGHEKMRRTKTLQLVDVHCGGEIGRVVTSVVVDLPGEMSTAEQNPASAAEQKSATWASALGREAIMSPSTVQGALAREANSGRITCLQRRGVRGSG